LQGTVQAGQDTFDAWEKRNGRKEMRYLEDISKRNTFDL